MTPYDKSFGEWQADPQGWWANAAEGIDWSKRWDAVFDPSLGAYGQWFAGGILNTSFNCLDRHIRDGRGDQSCQQLNSDLQLKLLP